MNMDCRKLNEALNIGGADCIPDAVEGIDYVVLSGGSFFKEPWNKKEVIVFGKKYKSVKDACKYNNISYRQYKVLVDEDLPIDNGEDLKTFIWERRNKRVAKGQEGNTNKRGWKSNPITRMRQSIGIKNALKNKE